MTAQAFLAAALLLSLPASAALPAGVIPLPAKIEMAPDPRPATLKKELLRLSLPTGIRPAVLMKAMRSIHESKAFEQVQLIMPGSTAPRDLALRIDPALPKEGYRLTADPAALTIHANDDAGWFYGIQTLLQLLTPAENNTYTVAPCTVSDSPRFAWRGLMVDDCRHFFGKETLKTIIREMAALKLNRLHWHLTDDQGWRIQINAYPLLTEIGAARLSSPKKGDRNTPDNTPYGPYFYTQADVAEIVRYAEEHCVTIVPEFETPGHACAAIAAYPGLSCRKQPKNVRTTWGVEDDVYCLGTPETLTFIDAVIGEMLLLFPGPYFHIGGDEAPHQRWEACPACQALLARDNLKKAADLQPWLVRRLSRHLQSARRTPVIWWEDCMAGQIPADTIVFCWRARPGVGTVSAQGNPIVVTYPYYLDYGQFPASDGLEYIYGLVTSQSVYTANPLKDVAPGRESTVIGIQGNMWSECTWTPEELLWKAFPRAFALAETAWSPEAARNWETFKPRAARYRETLAARGIKAAPVEMK